MWLHILNHHNSWLSSLTYNLNQSLLMICYYVSSAVNFLILCVCFHVIMLFMQLDILVLLLRMMCYYDICKSCELVLLSTSLIYSYIHSFPAFLWQLMRFNMLQLLKNLRSRFRGKEITDADILMWANKKVKNTGRKSKMESFKVKYHHFLFNWHNFIFDYRDFNLQLVAFV